MPAGAVQLVAGVADDTEPRGDDERAAVGEVEQARRPVARLLRVAAAVAAAVAEGSQRRYAEQPVGDAAPGVRRCRAWETLSWCEVADAQGGCDIAWAASMRRHAMLNEARGRGLY